MWRMKSCSWGECSGSTKGKGFVCECATVLAAPRSAVQKPRRCVRRRHPEGETWLRVKVGVKFSILTSLPWFAVAGNWSRNLMGRTREVKSNERAAGIIAFAGCSSRPSSCTMCCCNASNFQTKLRRSISSEKWGVGIFRKRLLTRFCKRVCCLEGFGVVWWKEWRYLMLLQLRDSCNAWVLFPYEYFKTFWYFFYCFLKY